MVTTLCDSHKIQRRGGVEVKPRLSAKWHLGQCWGVRQKEGEVADGGLFPL